MAVWVPWPLHPHSVSQNSPSLEPSDNHVVSNRCGWWDQEFTHVSGTLGGGVGYMCAGTGSRGDCYYQVRVEGTAARSRWGGQVTLNSGDAVLCSA